MTKCENCYHYHMCDLQNRLEDYQDCKYFKDKSLIVELPCKVGDTVWIIFDDTETAESRVISSIKLSENRFTLDFTDFSCFTIWSGYCGDYFGESIFLTREEAEKALKKYEK